uniref:Rab-GAP TBC domain-containing protein n=1 Tax=Lactuca sativa TaxID=4236 RepID=A0A9R1X7Z9_LACSA|nr:hypothetical protein LSAT_V11C500293310 [Lactuca sativa]
MLIGQPKQSRAPSNLEKKSQWSLNCQRILPRIINLFYVITLFRHMRYASLGGFDVAMKPAGSLISLYFINRPEWLVVDHACISYILVLLYDTLGLSPIIFSKFLNHLSLCFKCIKLQLMPNLAASDAVKCNGTRKWSNFLDYEGLVMDPNALKKRIFFGEVEYSLRKEVWEFLLGSYLYDSTYAERWYIVSVKTSEYMTFKKINGR